VYQEGNTLVPQKANTLRMKKEASLIKPWCCSPWERTRDQSCCYFLRCSSFSRI